MLNLNLIPSPQRAALLRLRKYAEAGPASTSAICLKTILFWIMQTPVRLYCAMPESRRLTQRLTLRMLLRVCLSCSSAIRQSGVITTVRVTLPFGVANILYTVSLESKAKGIMIPFSSLCLRNIARSSSESSHTMIIAKSCFILYLSQIASCKSMSCAWLNGHQDAAKSRTTTCPRRMSESMVSPSLSTN